MDELQQITQHLLRFSPDALIVVDGDGRIRFANDTVTDLFGHSPQQLLGQPLDTLIPERLRSRHGAHLSGYLRAPGKREMGARLTELFARRADGSEFAAGIRLAPFNIGGRQFVAAAVRDNTERQEINEALIAAREEADRANRAKSRFLATASHDLRQPIQTIRLLNAAMLKVVTRPQLRELLLQQEQAIDGMTRLLNALLDISRLESGAIEPQPAQIPLAELFRELEVEFHSLAQAHGIALSLQPAPLTVSTDRILFSQLLQNLLGNALKYTEQGQVWVTCQQQEKGLTISIRDTGVGIPADKLERIFDEYYQVDTHGAQRPGVGLGLAIVKEVARLLGFKVAIRSTVGEGTCATVSIPNALVQAATVLAPPLAAAVGGPGQVEHPPVLLVEDNDGVRLATELFLQFEGFKVRSAACVADAEQLFTDFPRGGVVVTDYHLDGGFTGLQLLERLREQAGYQVPGIVLSGDLPTVLRSSPESSDHCRFLSKPVDTHALLEGIDELAKAAAVRSAAVEPT